MGNNTTARLDSSGIFDPVLNSGGPGHSAQIIPSISTSSPILERIDMVSLDASQIPLHRIVQLRSDYSCPAILDIPGNRNHLRRFPLTTRELLYFASAENFDWVRLHDVRNVQEIFHARDILDPSIQIAATVGNCELLQGHLDSLCAEADALIVDIEALQESLEGFQCRDILRYAFMEAARYHIPCYLALKSAGHLLKRGGGQAHDLLQLQDYLREGCAGFFLGELEACAEHPQVCIELLKLFLQAHGRTRPVYRKAAHVAGFMKGAS